MRRDLEEGGGGGSSEEATATARAGEAVMVKKTETARQRSRAESVCQLVKGPRRKQAQRDRE